MDEEQHHKFARLCALLQREMEKVGDGETVINQEQLKGAITKHIPKKPPANVDLLVDAAAKCTGATDPNQIPFANLFQDVSTFALCSETLKCSPLCLLTSRKIAANCFPKTSKISSAGFWDLVSFWTIFDSLYFQMFLFSVIFYIAQWFIKFSGEFKKAWFEVPCFPQCSALYFENFSLFQEIMLPACLELKYWNFTSKMSFVFSLDWRGQTVRMGGTSPHSRWEGTSWICRTDRKYSGWKVRQSWVSYPWNAYLNFSLYNQKLEFFTTIILKETVAIKPFWKW